MIKTPNKAPHILLVDDEPDLLEILSMEVEDEGYSFETAKSGREAFHKYQQGSFDAVISDIRMKDGDGVELLENIQKLKQEVPVFIFVTAYAEIKIEDAYDKGADALFFKPIEPSSLFKLLRKSLNHRSEQLQRSSIREVFESTISVRFKDQTAPIQSTTCNLGRGGLFVQVPKPTAQKGQELEFSLLLNDNQWGPIEGKGIIRWVRHTPENGLPTGYGIEFLELEKGSSERVVSLINGIKTHAFIPKN